MPPELESNPYHNFTINLFPRSSEYANALRDIVKNNGWNEFTLIYQDRDSLARLHKVLENHNPEKGVAAVRRIPSDRDEYRPFLKNILKSKEARYIIDLEPDTFRSLIEEGESIDFVKEYTVNFNNFYFKFGVSSIKLNHIFLFCRVSFLLA